MGVWNRGWRLVGLGVEMGGFMEQGVEIGRFRDQGMEIGRFSGAVGSVFKNKMFLVETAQTCILLWD